MSASKKIVKKQNLCVASEIGKSGRPVTVSMIDPLITSTDQFGWQFVINYEPPPKNLKSPALVIGSMLPALFKADGFDFEVQFRVTMLKVTQTQSRFAVTDIHLNGIKTDRAVPVDSSIVYPNMLLRLAIRASAVTGIAYPAGWTIDAITGEYLTTLKVGDEQPINTTAHGVNTTSKTTAVSVSRSFSGNPNLPRPRGRIVVALTEPAVFVHKVGREVDHAELNNLIGKVQKPKASSDSMTDPKVQQIVAKLYALPVPDHYTSQVEYVRSELTKHGIYKSESWVRQTVRLARTSKATKRKQAK
jgi:hypothetical protein